MMAKTGRKVWFYYSKYNKLSKEILTLCPKNKYRKSKKLQHQSTSSLKYLINVSGTSQSLQLKKMNENSLH